MTYYTQMDSDVEFVSCFKNARGSTVYHINDGFYYLIHRSDSSRVYLRCAKRNMCSSRASMPLAEDFRTVDNFVVAGGPHSHEPDFTMLQVTLLKLEILRRCREENTPYRVIFNQECESVESEVASQVDFNSMYSVMYRARNAGSSTSMESDKKARSVNTEAGSCASTSNTQNVSDSQIAEDQYGSANDEGRNSPLTDQNVEPEFGSFEKQISNLGSHTSLAPESSAMETSTLGPEVVIAEEIVSTDISTWIDEITRDHEVSGTNVRSHKTSNTQSRKKEKEVNQKETEIGTVNVKINKISNSQPSGKEKEPSQKEDTQTSHISAKSLESAIQRLESVSDKLTAASLVDSFDQFGKYISSVLRGLPKNKVYSLKQKIMSDVMQALCPDEASLHKKTRQNTKAPVVGTAPEPQSFGNNIPAVANTQPTLMSVNPTYAMPQVPVIASVASMATLNTPSPRLPKITISRMSEALNKKIVAGSQPKPTLTESSGKNVPLSSQPTRGRKRRKSQLAQPTKTKALSSREVPSHQLTSSDDEGSMDDQHTGASSKSSNQQDCEMDIEEETPDLEEPPDGDAQAADSSPPSPATASTTTCCLCNAECLSKEDLMAHVTSAH